LGFCLRWLDRVEVTADSLYDAVAPGLAAMRDAEWAGDIGHGQTTITVVVRQPEVEHNVRMGDFQVWLDSNGRSPVEMASKSHCRLRGVEESSGVDDNWETASLFAQAVKVRHREVFGHRPPRVPEHEAH
jgi:hypothetical protein